jgi:hypothetical protein
MWAGGPETLVPTLNPSKIHRLNLTPFFWQNPNINPWHLPLPCIEPDTASLAPESHVLKVDFVKGAIVGVVLI